MTNSNDLVLIEGQRIRTPRLLLRPWADQDAAAALTVFGDEHVARWLAPAVGRVPNVESMRALMARWAQQRVAPPSGRWAVEVAESGEVVGALALLPLPPANSTSRSAGSSHPAAWGRVTRPRPDTPWPTTPSSRASTSSSPSYDPATSAAPHLRPRIGMEWVGETEQELRRSRLQVYRLRKSDLHLSGPAAFSYTAPGGDVLRVAAQPRALNAESAAAIRAARVRVRLVRAARIRGSSPRCGTSRATGIRTSLGGLVIDARSRAARSIRSAPHAGEGPRRRTQAAARSPRPLPYLARRPADVALSLPRGSAAGRPWGRCGRPTTGVVCAGPDCPTRCRRWRHGAQPGDLGAFELVVEGGNQAARVPRVIPRSVAIHAGWRREWTCRARSPGGGTPRSRPCGP